MLSSDFGQPLRSEGLAKEGRRSLLTLARLSDLKAPLTLTRFSDREYTEPLLTALLRPAQSEPTRK